MILVGVIFFSTFFYFISFFGRRGKGLWEIVIGGS